MKETLKLGLTLLIIAAIAGGVLSGVNSVTEPIITEMKKEAAYGAFFDIFEEADDFAEIDEALLEDIIEEEKAMTEVLEALDASEEKIGYILQVRSGGYGGDMVTALGVNLDGTLAGMKVVDHSETPGIGDKIEDASFTDSFVEKSAEADLKAVDSPAAEDEVQMISGTTVSVNAVVNGVNRALGVYRDFLVE